MKLADDYINEALIITLHFKVSTQTFFKISKVTPVDKGGGKTNPSNYRPISTLSALAQTL